MVKESLYLCSMTSALPMGALMCIVHLLPLLHLLFFVINAHNKCVTLAWVIIMENDDSSYFSTHQLPPLFVSSSVGQDKSTVVCRFMFLV